MRKAKAYWMIGIYWLANGLINLSNLGGPGSQSCKLSGLERKLTSLAVQYPRDTPLIIIAVLLCRVRRRERRPISCGRCCCFGVGSEYC